MKKYRVWIKDPRCYVVDANSSEEAFKRVQNGEGEEVDMICNDITLDECEEIV